MPGTRAEGPCATRPSSAPPATRQPWRPRTILRAMAGNILTLKEITDALGPVLEAGGAHRAVLFGSYARGGADEHSDVDLVIIKETQRPFLDRYGEFEGLSRLLDKGMDVLVYTPGEFAAMKDRGNPFISKVMEDGVVIYEA